MSEAKVRAVNKYNKEHTKCIQIRLNYNTDQDIIAKLEQVPSKMGYIKSLIRKDLQHDQTLNMMKRLLDD